ncbi:MAG: tRNA lysidine(34) synthetase TilS [Ruminococcaceae bacterium]|nr:tRNA lysidine(34) synthetase TilS [Oscillospiraceae bacterium]
MTHFTEPHLLSGLPKDTPILLALSGGADSRALLHMLLSYGAPLAVAHVEHGIRGESSLRDLKFCEKLAKEAGIPFYALQTDIPALAKQNRMGLEEQARAERYRFFETVMREQSIPILATAHNATDNAETLLFRMVRGTGLSGLSGIAPARPFGNGVLIRPLLEATKEEILAYCEKNALDFVTDETNEDISFARNRIRHNLLPELTALNGEAVRHMSELCRTLREDEACLTDAARQALEKEEENGVALATLMGLPPAIQNRVLALLFGEPPLSAKNREELLSLAARGIPHASLDLPNARRARVENGRLLATVASENAPTQMLAPTPVTLGATALFDEKMLLVLDREASPHEMWKSAKNIYKNATTIYINSDRIRNGLFVRTRQAGDTVLLHGQHKKLRKLQNEAALPLSLRTHLPLLCDKEGILWAPLTALRDGIGENANLRVTLFY